MSSWGIDPFIIMKCSIPDSPSCLTCALFEINTTTPVFFRLVLAGYIFSINLLFFFNFILFFNFT